ncbi:MULTISPECIES: TVP38/TMEM64 family protein [Enterococcus]|uniref:TVP38/TMEM64 family membrane protein n=1 Tax=Enterococcus wangshanyuanii TaxID=2005703 RepID=A0ABQ1P089_9ENTE|nr:MULTISPECIES: TVP38/TMEM64 family protein [Enterococcus]MCA5014052.1 TVP38/TMEM64 family protein [Enterococcus sp. S23]MCA5017174.1 TVP38/TMEM64 family protein [Enterococcus sp. S22(2020)]GGC88411.1 TVP38/TMEM64 family protein [Enterococcus wangshanyuanii]
MERTFLKRIIYVLPILGVLCFTALVIYGYSIGIFRSVQSLQTFIDQFGEYAVFIFIFLQILQVIVPILPGGISTVVGMLMFGNLQGLFYSYIGLIIGEIIVYWLARYYGKSFVRLILSKKRYLKFERMVDRPQKGIKKLMILTLLVPFAPDDLVCLVAGLTELPFKEYMKILLIFKFWSVATYGYAILFLFNRFLIR